MEFCPIASGSGGNCVYLGTAAARILVDAGLSGVRVERALASLNISPLSLRGIFLTHEHGDHILGAGVLARRYNVDIYATEGTWDYIERTRVLGKLRPEQKRVVCPGEDLDFGDMRIRPFIVSHDAASPVGYSFFFGGVKATVATDLGYVDKNTAESISDSDILLIESNHDLDMLHNGPYPQHLKRRILSDKGHLSNVTCGQILTDLAHGLKHIYLGHLSAENNDPLLAFETVRDMLEVANIPVNSPCGAGVSLYLADRDSASKFLRLM